MAELTVDAGICGFTTVIRATSQDMQTVTIEYDTTCPHAACPTYSAFLKAVEATAGLALPRDVSMRFSSSPHA